MSKKPRTGFKEPKRPPFRIRVNAYMLVALIGYALGAAAAIAVFGGGPL